MSERRQNKSQTFHASPLFLCPFPPPSSLSALQVATSLDLVSIENRSWRIQGCSALTGTGVEVINIVILIKSFLSPLSPYRMGCLGSVKR